MGDFRAQIAAIRTGERRLTQLLQRYGAETFKESVRLIFDQSEKLARAAVEKIPDGVYEAESFMDDDGVNLGKHIPIKVRVEVRGDEMTVDLSGVSPQVAGPYNSGSTAGRSASEVAFKFLTTPLLLPINDGSFRPLKVILPPGRVVSATKPAPVRTWMTVPMTVADTIFKALAPRLSRQCAGRPSRRPRGSAHLRSRSQNRPRVSFSADAFRRRLGRAARSRRAERDLLHQRRRHAQHAGGSGRRERADFHLLSKIAPGFRRRQENFAAGSAWRRKCACSRRAACNPRWSGRCARRGDCTAVKTRWPIASASCARTDRYRRLPTGKTVGHVALERRRRISRRSRRRRRILESRLERDPERVLADVRSGYVSLEAARRDYGVVIRQNGRKFELDVEATRELRRARNQAAPLPPKTWRDERILRCHAE